MSFESPTPIEVAVQGISVAAQKVQTQLAKLDFLRDLQKLRFRHPITNSQTEPRPSGAVRFDLFIEI